MAEKPLFTSESLRRLIDLGEGLFVKLKFVEAQVLEPRGHGRGADYVPGPALRAEYDERKQK